MITKLSIIIPVYNEEKTLSEITRLVEEVKLDLEKEIIFVDDGSTDSSLQILKTFKNRHLVIFLGANYGKGRAIREGFKFATGDIVLIQDADLEYDPKQYPNLIQSIISGQADVVYGSRFVTNQPRRVLYFNHYLANRFLTFISNIFSSLNGRLGWIILSFSISEAISFYIFFHEIFILLAFPKMIFI